jgi:hypothetical protein
VVRLNGRRKDRQIKDIRVDRKTNNKRQEERQKGRREGRQIEQDERQTDCWTGR